MTNIICLLAQILGAEPRRVRIARARGERWTTELNRLVGANGGRGDGAWKDYNRQGSMRHFLRWLSGDGGPGPSVRLCASKAAPVSFFFLLFCFERFALFSSPRRGCPSSWFLLSLDFPSFCALTRMWPRWTGGSKRCTSVSVSTDALATPRPSFWPFPYAAELLRPGTTRAQQMVDDPARSHLVYVAELRGLPNVRCFFLVFGFLISCIFWLPAGV